MNCSYEEIGHLSVTFPESGCTSGKVCKLNDSGMAVPCSDGDMFCGVVETVAGGYAGVQIHGFVEVAYTSTAPEIGYANLVADGNGGVKVSNTGDRYLVAAVDTVNSKVTMEM